MHLHSSDFIKPPVAFPALARLGRRVIDPDDVCIQSAGTGEGRLESMTDRENQYDNRTVPNLGFRGDLSSDDNSAVSPSVRQGHSRRHSPVVVARACARMGGRTGRALMRARGRQRIGFVQHQSRSVSTSNAVHGEV